MIYLFVLLATISSLYFTIFSKAKLTKEDKKKFDKIYFVSLIISIFYYFFINLFTILPTFGKDIALISFFYMAIQLFIVYFGVYVVIFFAWRYKK